MVCKTCGAVINDSDTVCKNCGDTIRVVDKKVNLDKEMSAQDRFRQNAEQFGGIIVKERRAKAFSGMNPKTISYILIALALLIITLVFFVYDRKRTTINVDGFEVTLPASMREVDDFSFEVMSSEKCRSFANTELEFTYVIYDVKNLIPELGDSPGSNDLDGLMEYYEGKDKLVTLKKDFAGFTYSDTAMTNNYVEMRIEVVDEKLYQFSVLYSSNRRDKLQKKLDEIYKSLKIDKK